MDEYILCVCMCVDLCVCQIKPEIFQLKPHVLFQPKLVSEFQLIITSLHVADIWREYTITYVLRGPIFTEAS